MTTEQTLKHVAATSAAASGALNLMLAKKSLRIGLLQTVLSKMEENVVHLRNLIEETSK